MTVGRATDVFRILPAPTRAMDEIGGDSPLNITRSPTDFDRYTLPDLPSLYDEFQERLHVQPKFHLWVNSHYLALGIQKQQNAH